MPNRISGGFLYLDGVSSNVKPLNLSLTKLPTELRHFEFIRPSLGGGAALGKHAYFCTSVNKPSCVKKSKSDVFKDDLKHRPQVK